MAQVTEVGPLEDEQVWGEVRRKSVSFELAEMEIHELSIHAGLQNKSNSEQRSKLETQIWEHARA